LGVENREIRSTRPASRRMNVHCTHCSDAGHGANLRLAAKFAWHYCASP